MKLYEEGTKCYVFREEFDQKKKGLFSSRLNGLSNGECQNWMNCKLFENKFKCNFRADVW